MVFWIIEHAQKLCNELILFNIWFYYKTIISYLSDWLISINLQRPKRHVHLNVTKKVNKTFNFSYNGQKIDREMKYRISQFARLWLQTRIFASYNSISYACINLSLIHHKKKNQLLLGVFFFDQHYLPRFEIQYLPYIRLGKYCTPWVAKSSYWLQK